MTYNMFSGTLNATQSIQTQYNIPWNMKFKEAFKNAIECNIQSIEAGSTKQANTDAHHCGCNERRIRRPSKAVFTVAHGCCKLQRQICSTDIAKMISYAANNVLVCCDKWPFWQNRGARWHASCGMLTHPLLLWSITTALNTLWHPES